MKDAAQRIKEYVMLVISDDYEDFETVMRGVSERAAEHGIAVDRQTVLEKLGEVINEDCATAYLYSEVRSEFEPFGFSAERVDDLWFYLTPKGIQLLKEVEEEPTNPQG